MNFTTTTNTAATAAAKTTNKKNFHIEKLRSLAFKTLMHSLRNEFNQIVPEHAQQDLFSVHTDLLDFMAKAFFFIPKIAPMKKNSVEGTSASTGKTSVRKATLSEIFGFNSFNKQFRERVFSDYMFAMPLLLILENYRHYRTKFKDEFVGIFDEFKTLCLATVSDFDAAEDIYKMKRQASKVLKCDPQEVDLVTFRLEKFAMEFGLSHDFVEDLLSRAKNGDLFNVFLTVVKRLESPLTVYGLKQCFELYLSLLKIKHYEPSVVMPLVDQTCEKQTSGLTLQSNASTGIPSENSTPRAATNYDFEFDNPIEQLIHEISVNENEMFQCPQTHEDFFKVEPQFANCNKEFAADRAEYVFTEGKFCDANNVVPTNFFPQDFELGNQNDSFLFPEIY